MKLCIALFILAEFAHFTWGFKAVIIGDFGQELTSGARRNQERTANAMGHFLERNKDHSLIVSTGDNFYPSGVRSRNDARFENTWTRVYWQSRYPHMTSLRWLMSVGNHDYNSDDGELYQVDYHDTTSRWHLPSLYYDYVSQGDGFTVHWVIIDTQSLRTGKHNPSRQLSWLQDTLRNSQGDYLIVVGHHPAFNAGNHGGSSTVRNQVVPLMERYYVDAYLCGHDHNLQHINKRSPGSYEVDYILSGGGGRYLYDIKNSNLSDLQNRGYSLRHFELNYGVVTLDFTSSRMRATYYRTRTSREELSEVYTFRRDIVYRNRDSQDSDEE